MLPSFSTQNTYISLDKALEFVGDNSQYQKRAIYLFSIQWVLFCFLLMGMPFLLSSPEFLCSSNGTLISCDEVTACSGPSPVEIDEGHSSSSISKDFMLYCGRKYYVGLCGFVFFLGSLLGGLIFPNLAERQGRRRVLLISAIIPGVTLVIMGLMSDIGWVLFCFLLIGMAYNGFEATSMIYINEISGDRFRNFASMTMTVVWAFGQIIYAGLTYFIDDWRVITIALIGVPFLLVSLFAYRTLLETPKFLINMNRYLEARIILNQIALFNKRPQFTYRLEGEMEEFQMTTRGFSSEPKPIERDYIRIQSENYGYVDLFRYRSLRSLTVCLLFLWFFKNFTYFGLAFSLPGFGGESHENFLLMAVAELVACFMSGPFKLKMTRIRALMSLVGCITVLCLAIGFFKIPSGCFSQTKSCYQKGLTVFIAMAARFCITVYSSVLLSYTGEIYPTVVKNLGFGICIAFGKLGALVTPIIVVSLQKEGFSSLVLFGSFGVIVALLITRLKETEGNNIGDYIEETQSDHKALLSFKDDDDKHKPLLS